MELINIGTLHLWLSDKMVSQQLTIIKSDPSHLFWALIRIEA